MVDEVPLGHKSLNAKGSKLLRKLIFGLCAASLACVILGAALNPPRREAEALPARGLPPLPAVTAIPPQRGWVDVNGGDAEELTALPGVGETLAAYLILEREVHGPFYYPEDLLSVKGIGEKKLEAIRDMLDLSGPEPD